MRIETDYIAFDGESFETAEDCKEYEETLNITFYGEDGKPLSEIWDFSEVVGFKINTTNKDNLIIIKGYLSQKLPIGGNFQPNILYFWDENIEQFVTYNFIEKYHLKYYNLITENNI